MASKKKSRRERKIAQERARRRVERERQHPASRGMVAAFALTAALAVGASQESLRERPSSFHEIRTRSTAFGNAPAVVATVHLPDVAIRYEYHSWMGERIERFHARLAALERILLRDITAHSDLADHLLRLAFEPDAARALSERLLGHAYMQTLNESLASLDPEDPVDDRPGIEPFHLYGSAPDGAVDAPTTEGIEVWGAMRRRLVRKESELGRRLPSVFGPAPRRVHPRTVAA